MMRNYLVTGTSTFNKGAELMHAAICDELTRDGDARIVVPGYFGSLAERARYDSDIWVERDRFFRDRVLSALAPRRLRRDLGLRWDRDIQAVVDASGFAFSDQLGSVRVERAAREFSLWRKQGKRIVLLPQALGPFRTDAVRDAMRVICEAADLIYAREKTSLEHLHEIAPGASNVKIAPDFTCLLKGDPSPSFEAPSGGVCIVPNVRMLRETDAQVSGSYLQFLRRCVSALKAEDVKVWMLVHDRGDFQVVNAALHGWDESVEVWHHYDARALKAALGRAHMVIGSRFHSLVSALTQGVPVIATSWSFKYEELLGEYGLSANVIRPDAPEEEISARLLTAWRLREDVTPAIQQCADGMRQKSREMWREVRAVLSA